MYSHIFTWIRFSSLLAILGICGCGEVVPSKVATSPAQGKVLFQGKPLPNALVVFEPEQPVKSADGTEAPLPSAKTDDTGSFILHTYEPDDGAPPGSYRVKISTAPVVGADEGILRKRATSELTDPLKGRYMNSKTSGLTATIKAGANAIEPFELK